MTALSQHIGLGLVPVGARSVSPVPAELLALVPKPTGKNETIKSADADPIEDTVPLIQKLGKRQKWQGEKLAARLKGDSLESTLRNDWNFIFNHIQYKQDPKKRETVRSLRRLVYDGVGDCDCFTNALQNLLLNQNIKGGQLRVAKYKKGADWSHIYIVVPKDGRNVSNGYYTLDPVPHKFNYEAPFVEKIDSPIMTLESMDGLGACPVKATPANLRRYVQTTWIEMNGLLATAKFLRENNVPYTDSVSDKGSGIVIIQTINNGPLILPTIMTKPQGAQAMAALTAPAKETATSSTPTASTSTANKKWSPWWFVGLGAAAIMLLTSSDSNSTEEK